MGYVYRGTLSDVSTPAEESYDGKPGPKPFDPSRCGSRSGYKQHKRRGVPACDACQEANNKYMAEYNALRRVPARPLAPCGTYAGFRRHQRNNEDVCDACDAAQKSYRAEYMRDYRARTAAA